RRQPQSRQANGSRSFRASFSPSHTLLGVRCCWRPRDGNLGGEPACMVHAKGPGIVAAPVAQDVAAVETQKKASLRRRRACDWQPALPRRADEQPVAVQAGGARDVADDPLGAALAVGDLAAAAGAVVPGTLGGG